MPLVGALSDQRPPFPVMTLSVVVSPHRRGREASTAVGLCPLGAELRWSRQARDQENSLAREGTPEKPGANVSVGVPETANVVIVGAGIVGNSLAYHLALQGWKKIVLLDKGPMPNPGGSTGHA